MACEDCKKTRNEIVDYRETQHPDEESSLVIGGGSDDILLPDESNGRSLALHSERSVSRGFFIHKKGFICISNDFHSVYLLSLS